MLRGAVRVGSKWLGFRVLDAGFLFEGCVKGLGSLFQRKAFHGPKLLRRTLSDSILFLPYICPALARDLSGKARVSRFKRPLWANCSRISGLSWA